MKPWFALVAIASFLTLSCATKPVGPKEVPPIPPEAETAPEPKQEASLRELEATYLREETEATTAAILQDTDIPQLVELIAKNKLKEVVLENKIEDLRRIPSPTESEKIRLEEAKKQLSELRQETKKAIDAEYREVLRINFGSINRWRLTGDMKEKLNTTRADLAEVCKKSRRILIYGYGCPKGDEESTRLISLGRAHEVRTWIAENISCTPAALRERGLGILVPEETLQKVGGGASEELLARSRHVRILVPRRINN